MNNNSNIIDFVIPLHRYHKLFRVTLEGISTFYNPKNIYVITPKENINILKNNSKEWNIKRLNILEDETFFIDNYKLKKSDIEKYYRNLDDNSREFGWWYQQLIKLGAYKQIKELSNPYMVWDSDLIPLIKWDISDNKFAILQEKARSEWNIEEYKKSIMELTGLTALDPEIGTFIPHHFIFYHDILNSLFNLIEDRNINGNWIKNIMDLTNNYYRFSEYKMVATYMKKYYPHLLKYHTYDKYGENGIRIRECRNFIDELENNVIIEDIGLSYIKFVEYIRLIYKNLPSYIQIEHI
jgi:hypothetical protein